MINPPLQQRLEALAELLDRLEVGAPAPEAALVLGELWRRRGTLSRLGLQPVLAALEVRARRLLTAARVAEALAGLRLDELSDLERSDADEPEAERALAEAFLAGRERAEALRWAASGLGLEAQLESPLRALRQELERLDRLGRAQLSRLLLANQDRQRLAAELDPQAAADWWWSLRASCRPLALANPEALSGEERAWLGEHLAGCAACREEAGFLEALDRLLGGAPEGHPSSARLSAHAAGELPAGEREALGRHLQGCPACRALHRAAAAALEEAARIEQGLALQERLASGQTSPCEDATLHLPLAIAAPPAARALAASTDRRPAPGPEDRRVLLEEPGEYTLVYYREGASARIGLFAAPLAGLELELQLEGAELTPSVAEPEALVFELGAAASLAGRRLELALRRQGMLLAARSFTIIEEER